MGLSKEEFEARRAARRKGVSEEAREAQMAIDREAIDALEAERDVQLDVSLSVKNFVPGHPVIIGVRTPTEPEYKRYYQSLNRAGAGPDVKSAAHTQLANVCWVYPDAPESRKALLAANPAILAQVGNLANKLAELRSEEEGKD